MRERPHKYEVELGGRVTVSAATIASQRPCSGSATSSCSHFMKDWSPCPGPRWTDEQIAEAFEMSRYTVIRIRERFVNHGLDDALNHRLHTQMRARALDGEQEAHLIALSCSRCPVVGQGRWTLRLLANRMVELGYVEHVSHETVRKTLKKTTTANLG